MAVHLRSGRHINVLKSFPENASSCDIVLFFGSFCDRNRK